jgi:hypothetical protein
MNDIVNLMCVAIIAFIIFYLIFKDYKVCENFSEELVCNNAMNNRIIEFFEESKENKYNEVKLNKILDTPENGENEENIKFITNKDDKNIYGVLTDSGYIEEDKTEKEQGEKVVVKYIIKKEKKDASVIEINVDYIIKLLQKHQKEKSDNIIIKVVKNSEVFDEGIIDIGKVSVISD